MQIGDVLELVDESARAAAILNPMRRRILDSLREPGSASTVARQLGIPRQKVNYHLRELEKAGFLEEIEERRSGNCIERIVRARATHYVINPEVLGGLAGDDVPLEDRVSSAHLIALAASTIRDVAAAQQKAEKQKKRVPTLALQTDVRFASAADRKSFIEELANYVAHLAAKYHDDHTPGGRAMRFIIGAYPPRPKEDR